MDNASPHAVNSSPSTVISFQFLIILRLTSAFLHLTPPFLHLQSSFLRFQWTFRQMQSFPRRNDISFILYALQSQFATGWRGILCENIINLHYFSCVRRVICPSMSAHAVGSLARHAFAIFAPAAFKAGSCGGATRPTKSPRKDISSLLLCVSHRNFPQCVKAYQGQVSSLH